MLLEPVDDIQQTWPVIDLLQRAQRITRQPGRQLRVALMRNAQQSFKLSALVLFAQQAAGVVQTVDPDAGGQFVLPQNAVLNGLVFDAYRGHLLQVVYPASNGVKLCGKFAAVGRFQFQTQREQWRWREQAGEQFSLVPASLQLGQQVLRCSPVQSVAPPACDFSAR